MQQKIGGTLCYPKTNYTASNVVNPNAPDYTSATGERYWYRAIKVQGNPGNTDRVLEVKLGIGTGTNALLRSDIYAFAPDPSTGDPVPFDSLPVRVRCLMPGPINPIGQGQAAETIDVGSNWSAICGGTGTGENASFENWFQSANSAFSSTSGLMTINWDTGGYAISRCDSVCIVEVRMLATATESRHYITSIEIETL